VKLALDSSGDRSIASNGNTPFSLVASEGNRPTLPVNAPQELSSPKGLAVDLAGNLFVANSGNGSVAVSFAGMPGWCGGDSHPDPKYAIVLLPEFLPLIWLWTHHYPQGENHPPPPLHRPTPAT